MGFYEKLLQAKKGTALSGQPESQTTYSVPLPWRELKTEARPCGHLQLPACRVKKGSVKEMVVVIAPMEDGLGRTKAGGHEETIGHAYVKKQSWKGNRKAAAWEKSSVAG